MSNIDTLPLESYTPAEAADLAREYGIAVPVGAHIQPGQIVEICAACEIPLGEDEPPEAWADLLGRTGVWQHMGPLGTGACDVCRNHGPVSMWLVDED